MAQFTIILLALCFLFANAIITVDASSCPPDAIFCEDFERDGTNSSWSLQGAASITSSGPVRGSRSLHLTPLGGKFGRLMLEGFSPKSRSFFGRIYLRVKKLPTAPNYSHWVFVEVLGNGTNDEQIRPLNGQLINEVGGKNMWGVGSDGGSTGDWTAWKESAEVTEDTWTCMEWQMIDSDSSVRVWENGLEKPELQVSRWSHGGKGELIFPRKITSIWFGFWNFQAETTPAKFDVYIDDIVLSHKRVRCQ